MKTLTRDDIEHMTEVEKLELIDALWDSLGDALTPEQIAELDRRLESFDEEAAFAVSWDDYKLRRAQRLG